MAEMPVHAIVKLNEDGIAVGMSRFRVVPGDFKSPADPSSVTHDPDAVDITDLPGWDGESGSVMGRQVVYETDKDGTKRATALGPAPDAPAPTVARDAFALLFTRAERKAIRRAIAAGVPAAEDIQDFYALLELSPSVGLGDAHVAEGLDLLVAAGLLTPRRRAAIAANEAPQE